MTMTKDNKVLALLQAIAETLEISPKGQPIQVDPKELEKSMNKIEIKQILQKLADDFGIIEILRTPYSFDVVFAGVCTRPRRKESTSKARGRSRNIPTTTAPEKP